MKNFFDEFKKFAVKGNVIDLAVGIIIGSAFGKIIASFVNDLFMPLISLLMGKTNFVQLKVILVEASGDTPELAIRYGQFIQTVIDFILIAFVVFIMVKTVNNMRKKQEEKPAAPPAPSNTEILLEEIRDLLRGNNQ